MPPGQKTGSAVGRQTASFGAEAVDGVHERRFQHADSIREMVKRTPTRFNSEDRNLFEMGLEHGKGIVAIEVTAEQFLKLRR